MQKTPSRTSLSPIKAFRAVRNKNDLTAVKANLGLPALQPHGQLNAKKALPDILSPTRPSSGGGDAAAARFDSAAAPGTGLGDLTPPEIVAHVRAKPGDGFLYMMPAHDRMSVDYHPYDVHLVPHSEIDPENYYTISKDGVQETTDGLSEFTPLDRWEQDYHTFTAVRAKKTFSQFRMWKQYATWRKCVVRWKRAEYTQSLKQSSYLLDAVLQPALLKVRNHCLDIVELQLCQIDEAKTYTVDDFLEVQENQVTVVSARLFGFREQVVSEVHASCDQLLAQTEESFVASQGLKSTGAISYTEEAVKAKLCQRLTNFIRLIDFLIAGAMQSLAIESTAVLQEHMQHLEDSATPTEAQLETWKVEDAAQVFLPPPLPPLFLLLPFLVCCDSLTSAPYCAGQPAICHGTRSSRHPSSSVNHPRCSDRISPSGRGRRQGRRR